jgi:hypothetical protein
MTVEIPLPELDLATSLIGGGIGYLLICYGWLGRKICHGAWKKWGAKKYGDHNIKANHVCNDYVGGQQLTYILCPLWLPFYAPMKYVILPAIYKVQNVVYNGAIPPESR